MKDILTHPQPTDSANSSYPISQRRRLRHSHRRPRRPSLLGPLFPVERDHEEHDLPLFSRDAPALAALAPYRLWVCGAQGWGGGGVRWKFLGVVRSYEGAEGA